ncbi:Transposon Ty3-I Gag-Pol polyprotein [Labeo rohita]|uniref:Transposon Ty3-I Gag-Pol polyprotein n=1 Tax=Labeo rohita TaxID=84645 RepID=A0ABQ8M4I3_LABRO|nr:Transposon Ty3-I Gag-Pol polyprotein [Labeo rohita]
MKGLPTAMEMAEILFQHLFRYFGLPEEIVSDRRPQFISHTNGQTERKIQELRRYLRAYCHADQHCWNRFLPWAEYAQNSLHQDTTGLTSFQCRAVRQHKRFADIRRRPTLEFQPGDQVWLSTRDLRLHQPCRKLSPRYIGPFKILRRINEVTFQLQLPPRYRIHPTFHVSLLKPCYPSATKQPGAEVEPPPPEILEPPSIYTVHEILGSRRRGGSWNISSTGRVMDLKSDPGSHGMMY